MYIGLHVKYPLFLADFNETWIISTDVLKTLENKISWKSDLLVVPCGRTDEQRDMTKLIVAFRNFANAPKNLDLKGTKDF